MAYLRNILGAVVATVLIAAPVAFAVEYEWEDASGAVKSLADYKGKPVVLHFWASWCPPCRNEMPELEAWSKAHGEVELIVISLDRNIDDAARFLDSKQIGFSALQGDMSRAFSLGVRGLPTTLVIGSDGAVRTMRVGAVAWESESESAEILQALEPLI